MRPLASFSTTYFPVSPSRVNFLIYSDVSCRRLREIYESIKKESPDIAEFPESIRVRVIRIAIPLGK